jgi:hypothetical protein
VVNARLGVAVSRFLWGANANDFLQKGAKPMIKAMIGATLDKYEIKYPDAGKVAKVTLLSNLEVNPHFDSLGVDPTEFLRSDSTVKKKVFQNIPILTEGFKIELWSGAEFDDKRIATHTFKSVSLDKVEVNMEPLNGEDADPVAIAKLVFTVGATADLNHWLFANLDKVIAVQFTQKVEQKKLDLVGLVKTAKKMGITGVERKNGKTIIHCDVKKMEKVTA